MLYINKMHNVISYTQVTQVQGIIHARYFKSNHDDISLIPLFLAVFKSKSKRLSKTIHIVSVIETKIFKNKIWYVNVY